MFNVTTIRCEHSDDNQIKELIDNMQNDLDYKEILSLNLSFNSISDTGAKYIADMLEQNSFLLEINLNDNKIGNSGLKLIAKALEKNTTLQKISLANTLIDDKGAKCIAEMLKINKSLQAIHLDGNNITDFGIEATANVLENSNGSLRKITFSAKMVLKASKHNSNNQSQVKSLLLCARAHCKDSFFYKDYLCEDLLKEIFRHADLYKPILQKIQ